MAAEMTAEMTAKQICGATAENDALAYLQQHGLRLIERNFRCKTGEIDLIMRDDSSLVFVEVRKRASMRFGGAAASVSAQKQIKLIRTAQFYLMRYTMQPVCRFDVIAIDGGRLTWIKNAIIL